VPLGFSTSTPASICARFSRLEGSKKFGLSHNIHLLLRNTGCPALVACLLAGDFFATCKAEDTVSLARTLLFVAASAIAANATIITYTESVTTSGTLDGTAFTNKLVTLTLTGDTASISGGPSIFVLNGPATVNVAGVGSDSFTDQISVFSNQTTSIAGFTDNTKGFDMLRTTNAAFSSYNLNGPIGPVSGASSSSGTGIPYTTQGGTLILGGPFNIDNPSIFTATAGAPEPGAVRLVLSGLAGMWRVGRRRD
jgi:hypothetical protein